MTARNSFLLALAVVGLLASAPAVVASVNTNGPPDPNLTKDDGLAEDECVNPGDTITYQICFDNCCPTTQPSVEDSNEPTCRIPRVIVVDLLPPEVTFVSASGDAEYVPESHAVIWPFCGDIDLSTAEAQTCLELVVEVNADTAPGSLITNVAGIRRCPFYFGDSTTAEIPIDEDGYEQVLEYFVTETTAVCPQEPPAPQECPDCPNNAEMVAAGWFCPGAGVSLSLAIVGLCLWFGRNRRL